MLLADLARYELQYRCIRISISGQVDRGQAVLLGNKLRESRVIIAKTRESRAQSLAGALASVLRLLKLLEREHLLPDQQLSNTAHTDVSPKKTLDFHKVTRFR